MFDTAFSGLISGRNPPQFFMIPASAAVSGFADELTRIAYVEVSASGRLHQALRPRIHDPRSAFGVDHPARLVRE